MKFREFHKKTGVTALQAARALFSQPPAPLKTYPRYRHVPLPKPVLPDVPFGELAAARRSTRTFSQEKALTAHEISDVLFAGAGIQEAATRNDDTPPRHHPSGGALYPIELYIALFRADGIPAGLYHYAVQTHALEQLPADPEIIWQSVSEHAPVEKPGAIIILSAVWGRVYPKYGEFAYRLALMEAGHLMQDMLLCAAGRALHGCPVAGFNAEHIARSLDIAHDEEDPLYLLLLGA